METLFPKSAASSAKESHSEAWQRWFTCRFQENVHISMENGVNGKRHLNHKNKQEVCCLLRKICFLPFSISPS
ncbi:unnamed protein product [Cylicocyclus nassatus]|uniref:Uncharacterized protein n=1 Tax=Cylicocyclus nassatus TaxID=53992 RepID=A0AA36DUU0_CYLNA|nr:unnamed protein product [Cylicocyclus nassatus]